MPELNNKSPLVLTVGHSNRSLEEFLELLTSNGVTVVADIRKMPGSRANPQFNGAELAARLAARGIDYIHLPKLGGLRKRMTDSPNGGWRNASFQGYADYMLTTEFEEGVRDLVKLTAEGTPVLMCAEVLPWRCHRSLVADALVVRGVTVEHIIGPGSRQRHTLRPWARVAGTTITYPPEQER